MKHVFCHVVKPDLTDCVLASPCFLGRWCSFLPQALGTFRYPSIEIRLCHEAACSWKTYQIDLHTLQRTVQHQNHEPTTQCSFPMWVTSYLTRHHCLPIWVGSKARTNLGTPQVSRATLFPDFPEIWNIPSLLFTLESAHRAYNATPSPATLDVGAQGGNGTSAALGSSSQIRLKSSLTAQLLLALPLALRRQWTHLHYGQVGTHLVCWVQGAKWFTFIPSSVTLHRVITSRHLKVGCFYRT